jgi:hypothetical protein
VIIRKLDLSTGLAQFLLVLGHKEVSQYSSNDFNFYLLHHSNTQKGALKSSNRNVLLCPQTESVSLVHSMLENPCLRFLLPPSPFR